MRKRILSCFMAGVLGAVLLSGTAFAENRDSGTNDLQVTLQTDKEEYSNGEQIQVSLTLDNQSKSDYRNIQYTITLPDGVKVENGSLNGAQEVLEAGQVSAYTITTAPLSGFGKEMNTGGTPEETTAGEKDSANDSVKTGDQSMLAPVILLALIAAVIFVAGKNKKSRGALFLVVCLLVPQFPVIPAKAEDTEENLLNTIKNWDGLEVKSSTDNKAQAMLCGDDIKIQYDSDRKSSVLSLGKGSYLELPQEIFENAGNQITFALDAYVDSKCSENANIFQFNPCGYAAGDNFWKDAPEISVKSNLYTTFYIGGRTINGVFNPSATYNNGTANDDINYAEPNGYKTRYAASSSRECTAEQWHHITLQISDKEYSLYIDGQKADMTGTVDGSDIASSLEYLFKEDILKTYVFNTIGNSVYQTEDMFIGKVDNVAVYYDTVSPEENSEANAEYYWNFSYETIIGEESEYKSDLNSYLGTVALTDTDVTMTSPDGNTKVMLKTDAEGHYYLAATGKETVLVEPSMLGLVLTEADLSTGLVLDKDNITNREINEEFSVLTGSKSVSLNHCNEIVLPFTADNASFNIIVRVYNDGFAYRYTDVQAGSAEKVVVEKECSEIILSDNADTWAFDLNGTYEGEYVKRTNRGLNALEALLSAPLLAEIDNYYLLVTEASVYNNDGEYCSSGLKTERGSKQLRWAFGLARDPEHESVGDLDSPGHIRIQNVETVNGFSTPWRSVIASDNLNTFCNSDMIAALNKEPDKNIYADTSYIKPGKVAWSWWAEDEDQGSYDKHKEYIDFAAENGWEYACLDVGWRQMESRLGELCEYAAQKGVGVFVWINYRDMKDLTEMDRLFKKWSDAGAVGLKTDYFESDEASVLFNMQNVALTAAKYQMMVLYHGCVRPAGEYRTYPNVLTMEAVQGEEWHKWFAYPTTQNCLVYPFTRNILGSMDYTPSAIRASVSGETSGFAIAKTVVYQSGLQHFSNAASIYKKYNGLSLLNHIPVTWDETTILDGRPGSYISMVRRNGDEYYYGAMTTEEKTFDVSMDFLGEGSYNAYIYQDNEEGLALVIDTKTVQKGDVLHFDLLKNGGAAVMITKEDVDLDCYETGGILTNQTFSKRVVKTITIEGNPYEIVAEVSAQTEMSSVDGADYTIYEAESSENTLAGTAVVAQAVFCSGGQKVGYVGLGAGNTLTFNHIRAEEEGDYEILLAYCCAETRKVDVTVNGTDSYEVTGLNSGSWTKNAVQAFTVHLNKGDNIITFGNAAKYAPDIDYIAVRK